MADTIEIKVPDIGDFDAVDIIEVLVAEGDQVDKEQSLITLESDKASMEVPSSHAGTIKLLKVKVGDKVGEGDVIATLEVASGGDEKPAEKPAEPAKQETEQQAAKPAPKDAGPAPSDADCDVVVIGAGPGGYSAAFRAADLGLKTVLIEKYEALGGVCLNVGCIPSKALLHVAHIIDMAHESAEHGVSFGKPKIDLDKLRDFKNGVIKKMNNGLAGMAKQRKVEVITGTADFTGSHSLKIDTKDGEKQLTFKNCIIAAGSRAVMPGFMDLGDDRIMDSTGALKLQDIPKRMLVVGGGIIGLEMATVYEGLGSKITVVELMDRIMMGADKDIIRGYEKKLRKRYENIFLKTKVTGMEKTKKGIKVSFEGGDAPKEDTFDRVLVSVGRRPNADRLNLDAAGLKANEQGFIEVDEHMRTGVSHIYAIGDIVGQPMLAHKATHEAKVAAECCAGQKSAFDARVIPSVAYTDPEVAWVGVTEDEAKEKGIPFEKGAFPWAASGRAVAMGAETGMTKLLFDPKTERIIGGSIIGPNAGDLISEVALAIEMDCVMADIGLTVHPHPTLGETVGMAAEVAEGTVTDLYVPKRK